MRTPIQSPPCPRDFMHKLVSNEFIARTEQRLEVEAIPKGRSRSRRKKIDSPVLLRLLTFSVQH